MSVADRLKAARAAAGFESAADAVRRFGWKESTYFGHENGSRGFRADTANEYARAYRVSREWLLFGNGDAPAVSSVGEGGDLVNVYNVEASAGGGAVVDDESVAYQLSFPPGYLRSITSANPRDLAIISVKGKSMEPTLADNDVVMIDTTKRDLSFDGLFVLRDGGASLLVKRVSRGRRRGTVVLVSDNPAYPPAERDVEDVEIIGKVVWRGVRE